MEDPLTALRPEQSCLFFRSDGKGGRDDANFSPSVNEKTTAGVEISQKQQVTEGVAGSARRR